MSNIERKRELIKEMGYSEDVVDKIMKADIIEWDCGRIVDWGSHADYDYYAVDVINGNGYYDNDGHFRRYAYNPED